MNNKLAQKIHIALFIVTIVGTGLYSVINKSVQLKHSKLSQLINGEYARTLEDEYDDQFFIKEFSVNLWAAVEYKLFNEGKDGLVVGKDGWLFTDEEFKITTTSKNALNKNIELIKWVNSEFAKQNITLVVVPVPAKARVYQDKLDSSKPDLVHQQSYPALLAIKQIHIADSLSAMQSNKAQAEQFLRTDTHWTPAGAAVVAIQTAHYISEHTQLILDKKSYVTELKDKQLLNGDLLSYLPLSPWFDTLLPKSDQLAVYETYEAADDSLDDLFAETTQSVALVGTSYSANPDWNFVGALKQALSTDIISYAQEGSGPIEPMMQFMQQHKDEMPDLELVIWEIPERYLSVNFYKAYAKQDAMELNSTLIAKEFTKIIWSLQ